MVDFISVELSKFEEQMINFIEAYYNILHEDKESNSINLEFGTNEWNEKIIKLLKSYFKEDEKQKGFNLRIEGMIKHLEETGKSEKKLEFYMILNIAEYLYEIYYNNYKKKKNDRSILIEYKMTQSIYKELITLRNELSHNQNEIPSLEYILRIYEDFYYLIKFMKPNVPNVKVNMNEQFLREITMNIHIYLEKNLEYNKSFELNDLIDEFKKFEKEMNLIREKKIKLDEKSLIKDTKNIIKSLFEYMPHKLPKYDFNKEDNFNDKEKKVINDESNIIKDDNEDDENENEDEHKKDENSLDNSSNDFVSDLGSFSSNSERSSINEKEGNIKKTDETNISISDSKNDIQKDI